MCRACEELIADPADAVVVAHEMGSSGPGREVYAHRDQVDAVGLIDPDLLRPVTRVWAVKAAAE